MQPKPSCGKTQTWSRPRPECKGEVVKKKTGVLYVMLLLVMCLYGSLYVANKYVVDTLDASCILLFRYGIASLLLIPVTAVRSKRTMTRIALRDGLFMCLIGIMGYAFGVGAQLLGTKYAGAATASVINAMNPIAITLLAAILLREKLVWYRIAAICLAVAGAVTIIGGVSRGALAGVWWSVLAVCLWSLMSVLIRRYSQKYDPLTVTTLCMASAAVVLVPVVIVWQGGDLPRIGGSQWAALVYIAVACTAVAHSLWNYCLSRLDASLCSMFYPVQPLVSAGLAAILLHEVIAPSLVIGGLLIILGLLLALWMEHRTNKPAITPEREDF